MAVSCPEKKKKITSIIFYQVLVCAPSNVAVDQLAEKISATGLKVSDQNSLTVIPSVQIIFIW